MIFCARATRGLRRMGRTAWPSFCSRNAHDKNVLVQRAQWKINQPPSLKRKRVSLEGSLRWIKDRDNASLTISNNSLPSGPLRTTVTSCACNLRHRQAGQPSPAPNVDFTRRRDQSVCVAGSSSLSSNHRFRLSRLRRSPIVRLRHTRQCRDCYLVYSGCSPGSHSHFLSASCC